MKTKRQEAILDIIATESIETQEDLLLALEARGYTCTQATVSRDIKELSLCKITQDGQSRYGVLSTGDSPSPQSHFHQGILSVMAVEFIVIIKTKPGLAMAVCTALDDMSLQGNAGTLAGDDTCVMIMTSKAEAKKCARHLQEDMM